MKTAVFLLTALLGFATTNVRAEGDAELGQGKSYPCAACHGLDGLKQAPGQPTLGGRPADQLLAAMHDIRAGRRLHPYMQILLWFMTEKDMADIAAHFARVDPSKAAHSANPYIGLR